MTSRGERLLSYGILLGFSLFALWPLVSTTLVAFNETGVPVSGLAWPDPWSLDSFVGAWNDPDAGIGRSLANTLFVAVIVVVVSVFLSILTGYAFGTMDFRFSNALFFFMLIGVIVPYEATVIPLYYEFRAFGLIDTYWAVILPDIGFSVAFGTFWLRAFFRSFPRELLDAAVTDGASRWQTLWRVIVPTGGSAILALATILFIFTWNNLLLAIVMITSPEQQLAPAALSYFTGRQHGLNYQLTSAAAVLVALPVIITYYLLQRRYGADVLAGSVKG